MTMTPGDIGFILAFSAVFIIWASINHQRHKRAVAQCREEGHTWEGVFSGLECSRCALRWPG